MASHSNALVFPGPAAPPNSRYFAFDSWNSRCRGNGLYSSEIRRSSRAVADARMGGASCQRSVFNRASGERPTDDGLFPIARGAFCRQKTPRPRRQKTRRWRSGGSSALRPPQTPRCRPVAPIARPLEDEDSLPCALRNGEAAPRKGRVTAASVFLLTFVCLSALAFGRRDVPDHPDRPAFRAGGLDVLRWLAVGVGQQQLPDPEFQPLVVALEDADRDPFRVHMSEDSLRQRLGIRRKLLFACPESPLSGRRACPATRRPASAARHSSGRAACGRSFVSRAPLAVLFSHGSVSLTMTLSEVVGSWRMLPPTEGGEPARSARPSRQTSAGRRLLAASWRALPCQYWFAK